MQVTVPCMVREMCSWIGTIHPIYPCLKAQYHQSTECPVWGLETTPLTGRVVWQGVVKYDPNDGQDLGGYLWMA